MKLQNEFSENRLGAERQQNSRIEPFASTVDYSSDMNCSANRDIGDGETADNRKKLGEIKDLWQFRSYLCRQARGISGQFGGKVDSSDLVQETLLEAYQQLDQFRGQTEGELAKWLSQMLSNNIIDAARALRRQKRDIARERSLDNREHSSFGGAANWIASDQTSPSICVHNAEQMLQLSKAVGKLPAAQQEVVVLHHLQGRSLAEVAESVNRSQAAVAGLLYRGLKSLRTTLAES